jgi:hypothetical protein
VRNNSYTFRRCWNSKQKKPPPKRRPLFFEIFYVWKNFRRDAPITPRTPVPRRTRLDGSGVGATGGGTGVTGLSVMVIVILLKN